jgi:hypothetical protein
LDFKRRADGGRARAFKIQFVPLPFVHITRQLTYEALRDFCAVTFFVLLFFYYFWAVGDERSFGFTGRIVPSGRPAASSRPGLSPPFDSTSSGKVSYNNIIHVFHIYLIYQ